MLVIDLAISAAMVVVTVLFHALALYALSRSLRLELEEERDRHIHPASPRALASTVALVLGLFAIHAVEIWAYAALYVLLGAVSGFEPALYFSTVTYAAIGYDDDLIALRWRMLGAIEGINGVLLLGWSTAFFVTLVLRRARG